MASGYARIQRHLVDWSLILLGTLYSLVAIAGGFQKPIWTEWIQLTSFKDETTASKMVLEKGNWRAKVLLLSLLYSGGLRWFQVYIVQEMSTP